jgi:predicted ATPase/class 3 adenylate cyclase
MSPNGTECTLCKRTFLLTDIEGSTAIYERVGTAFREALAIHHAALRAEIDRHGGRAVRDTGDGILAAFEEAADGIACAIAAQDALTSANWPRETGPLRVRMGVHCGIAEFDGSDYHGLTMHHSARVMSAAHGGQILCSEPVADALPEGALPLRDLGLYRLRGVPQPMRLFEVGGAPDGGSFPLPNALPAFTHRLPVPPTRYFGRESEIAELCSLLQPLDRMARSRPSGLVVTLLGPGGNGKTRLAIEVAGRLLPAYSHAVWFVPLAELRDASLLFDHIRNALGLTAEEGVSAYQQTVAHLRAQPTLLVLDNLEQLLPECAVPISDLLAEVRSLNCLVTSRARLEIGNEQEYAIAPLRLPSATTPAESLTGYAAVQLFMDRARAVRRDFAITHGNAADVIRLVRALEGIPLALELAAARVAVLTPRQMLDRLHNRLDLLAGGRRDMPERHRTLRATIAWSYELLPAPLQQLFARLSIFRGGWTLEAAEQVCAIDALAPASMLDALAELRGCSLINARETSEVMRFEMLEVIRDYAQERLQLDPGREAVAARHHGYFAAMAIADSGDRQAERFSRLAAEQENLREMLGGSGPAAERLRAAVRLRKFWLVRGEYREGRVWLERLAAEAGDLPDDLPYAAANARGILAWRAGDLSAARMEFERALRHWEANGSEQSAAGVLNNLGILSHEEGDPHAAAACYLRSMAAYRRLPPGVELAAVLSNLGDNAIQRRAFNEARAYLVEALAIQERFGDVAGMANTLHNLGDLDRECGDLPSARRALARSLAIRFGLESHDLLPEALLSLARVARAEDAPRRAAVLLAASAFAREDDASTPSPASIAELERESAAIGSTLDGPTLMECRRIARSLNPAAVINADGDWLVAVT